MKTLHERIASPSDEKQWAKDVRLCNAAPELLALLKDAVRWLPEWHLNDPLADRALKLIRKVEGSE